jgi:hypothetical protein
VPVSSQVHAPPSLGDECNKIWRNLIESHFPAKPEECQPRVRHRPRRSRGPTMGGRM